MEKKLRYSLDDLAAVGPLSGHGAHLTGTCPVCGKQHLSIDTAKGLYHCFYAGCGFGGRLCQPQDKVTGASRADVPGVPSEASTSHAPAAAGGGVGAARTAVTLIPSDFRRLAVDVTDNLLTLMTDQPDDLVPDTVRQARAYLREQGIDLSVAHEAGVRVVRHIVFGKEERNGRTDPCVVYVNHVGGQPVNAKYRSVIAKLWAQDSPTTPCPPYHIDCLNPLLVAGDSIDRLCITEGEKDTLALLQSGYRYVVSVPSGAESDVPRCFEAFREWTDAAHSVVLCTDTDYPGRVLRQHLIDYFGACCCTVDMPSDCKDIADVLRRYGAEGVRQVVDTATPLHSTDIVTVDDLRQQVVDVIEGHDDKGFDLGYGPLTDHVLHLTDQGGLIILTGKPNSGKTDWLNDLCAHLMFKCGRNVCLCSFETPDKAKHISKMVHLALGRSDLSLYGPEEIRRVLDVLDGHLTHLDLLEYAPTPENILLLADMVLLRRRMHMLVVDPYMFVDLKVTARDSETNAIKRMLVQFQTWGRRNHVWVTVVAHPRKLAKVNGTNELEQIDMYTIAGSANWANLADFILAISRHTEQGERPNNYTRLDVLKVRDQDLCSTGAVLYRRQPCGRYDERPNVETLLLESQGKVVEKDQEVWGGLMIRRLND